MLILLAILAAIAIIWWLGDLTGELFTLATIVISLYQLLH
jgi:hypothetical protein